MKDLCTIETVALVLRLTLQCIPDLQLTSNFFRLLATWIQFAPLSSSALHQLKVDLIEALGPVAGWTPCQSYVSIGAILSAAIKTLPTAEATLFCTSEEHRSNCRCPLTIKQFNNPTVYVAEKLSDSTLSVQASIHHLIDYCQKMPMPCEFCGEFAVEHRKKLQ